MAKTKTTTFDVAEHLRTPEERALFLEIMIEDTDGDPVWIMRALNTIARSEGMTNVSRKSGLSRENLYRSLSGTKKPEFGTIMKVMAALGLQFHVVAKASKATKVIKTTKLTKVTKSTQTKKTTKSITGRRVATPAPSIRAGQRVTLRKKARIKQAA